MAMPVPGPRRGPGIAGPRGVDLAAQHACVVMALPSGCHVRRCFMRAVPEPKACMIRSPRLATVGVAQPGLRADVVLLSSTGSGPN